MGIFSWELSRGRGRRLSESVYSAVVVTGNPHAGFLTEDWQMHRHIQQCHPKRLLVCPNCYLFWCFDCAYHKYIDQIFINNRTTCLVCKEEFGIFERNTLKTIYFWGFLKSMPKYDCDTNIDPICKAYVRRRVLYVQQADHTWNLEANEDRWQLRELW